MCASRMTNDFAKGGIMYTQGQREHKAKSKAQLPLP